MSAGGRTTDKSMPLDIFMTWFLVGLIAGCLARLVTKAGGYGLLADLLLGLAGSLIGSSIFQALETSPKGGRLTMGAVAFVGAASMIVGQRWWYPHP
jgi:uncharacterized membrane protein YeaQ/YmgE (transglycosylase-associated protein family)